MKRDRKQQFICEQESLDLSKIQSAHHLPRLPSAIDVKFLSQNIEIYLDRYEPKAPFICNNVQKLVIHEHKKKILTKNSLKRFKEEFERVQLVWMNGVRDWGDSGARGLVTPP